MRVWGHYLERFIWAPTLLFALAAIPLLSFANTKRWGRRFATIWKPSALITFFTFTLRIWGGTTMPHLCNKTRVVWSGSKTIAVMD
ncbi:hypothetical protein KCP76_13690 [Salmonella enterica subsp. enterica serovar Weltevreden]|nr:hypothetical protein KCP76_13690 [Salmonella enterica subsp. enterica serovar Weltevreden]